METPFLDYLDDATRAVLVEALAPRRYERDQFIVTHLDQKQTVFFVLEGRAQVRVYSLDGKIVAFRTIEPGGVFGELSAIDGAPRSASVQALEPALVGQLEQPVFEQMLDTRPRFARAMLMHMAAQVRDMTRRMTEFRVMRAPERLVLELLRMAERGRASDGGVELAESLTHHDLALRVGTQREEVTREIGKLNRKGILGKAGGRLVIRDLGALRELAGPPSD